MPAIGFRAGGGRFRRGVVKGDMISFAALPAFLLMSQLALGPAKQRDRKSVV